MKRKIFKFGGASVKDAQGILNMQSILNKFSSDSLVVICSAMGKTTNLMEGILEKWFIGAVFDNEFHQLKDYHVEIAQELDESGAVVAAILPVFERLSLHLLSHPSDRYDFEYDQLVSYGELLSTTLISSFLNLTTPVRLANAVDLIITDSTYRNAKVDWEETNRRLTAYLGEMQCHTTVLQGFISGTTDGKVTTLGREGSDYSAAIVAYCLDAHEVTIWKDVPGLFNADPKKFPNAVKIDHVSYQDAVELSYYGASIIHPKTIKPLQNKNITLNIKSFFAPYAEGTIINGATSAMNVPSYIFKENQLLLTIFPKDFSFIAADNLSLIYSILYKHQIPLNLMQNSALSYTLCTDNNQRKFGPLMEELERYFKIKYNENVRLVTIWNHSDVDIDEISASYEVVLEQKNRVVHQVVMRKNA